MDDLQLIERYRRTGDNRELGILLKRYKQNLFGLAYYYLGDKDETLDIVMDTYEVIIKTIDDKVITNFKSWALSICRNLTLKKLRDSKKFAELTENELGFMESDSAEIYNSEEIDRIIGLIPSLKHGQKLCIENFYLRNKSYAEIAEEYEMSLKEVKSHIQNGKRNLKLLFERT